MKKLAWGGDNLMKINKDILISKKFFNIIYLWITLTIFLLFIIFSSIIFVNVQKNVVENNNESNNQVLAQIQYNINSVDSTILKLCQSVYYDYNAVYVMENTDSEESFSETLTKMNKLSTSVINFNPFIHSIFVYNSKKKSYYSTLNGALFKDPFIDDVISSNKRLPIMTPIYRTFKNELGNDEEILTFAMYEPSSINNLLESTIFINVKVKWLVDNINTINMIKSEKNDSVYILGDNKEYIDNTKGNDAFKLSLKNSYNKYIDKSNKSGKSFNFYIDKINGEKYVITYLYLEKTNWTILRIQPYDEVYKYVNKVKFSIVIINIIFLIIAFIVSILVSKKIYSPIGKLVDQVKENQSSFKNLNYGMNEITLLQEIYKQSFEKLKKSEKDKSTNKEILKTYYLRKLLIDSSSFTVEDFEKEKKDSGIVLESEKPSVVVIFKLDDYDKLYKINRSDDMKIINYGLSNVINETISKEFICEIIEIKNDQLAAVINLRVDSNNNSNLDILIDILKNAQDVVLKYFKVSVSTSISRSLDDFSDITIQYSNALNNIMYKYIYGKR